jgi:hypothetical protein
MNDFRTVTRGDGRRPRLRRMATGLIALAVFAPVVFVTAGPAEASGPNVVQARSAAAVTLPDAGGTPVTVESVSLTRGFWTVTSNAIAVNFGAGDFFRCQLEANGVLIDGGATTYLAGRVGGLVNAGTWKAGGAFTVALRCDHDNAASSAGQFYLDPGVTLTAVRGGPIQSPTVHTSATPTVVESRTSSAVSLVKTTMTPVTSVTLPPGTWAATANASAVDFAGFDWANCYLAVSSGGGISSSGPSVGVTPTDSSVSGVTVEATATIPAAGGTVALMCDSSFTNDVYLDPGATLTATFVPTASGVKTHPIGQVTLPDPGGTGASVMSQAMPAGAWRIETEVTAGLRAPNNAYGPGTDFVRCTLWANDTKIDGGATILANNGYIEELVNVGSFTATTKWTLRLSCAHDSTISTGDHWTVIEGMAQAVRKGPITTAP